jgi:hypothetical protein
VAALLDQVRRLHPFDHGLHPHPADPWPDPKPRRGADTTRRDPLEVVSGDEVIGERGPVPELDEEIEHPFTRNVDRGPGRDGVHGGAILFASGADLRRARGARSAGSTDRHIEPILVRLDG